MQFIPARGRKLITLDIVYLFLPLQFIPARGRKRCVQLSVCLVLYCNLSPRGDGNSWFCPPVFRWYVLQFIPARGRKLLDTINRASDVEITIYPRKGTETLDALNSAEKNQLQFIPARGRKLKRVSRQHLIHILQFIPARGQKSTSATGVCQQRRCFAFSYILFYRLGTAPAGIVFVTGSALTPCGTSGFMGRISCR